MKKKTEQRKPQLKPWGKPQLKWEMEKYKI